MPDMSIVTQRYFTDFDDPDVINTGWCYIWAWMAYLHFGPDVQLATYEDSDGGHALVIHNGRFYDSSAPQGVEDMEQLWYFRWWGVEPCKGTLFRQRAVEYKQTWRDVGTEEHWWAENGLRPWPLTVPNM